MKLPLTYSHTTQRGFTIVELLIVIVVVGILATITVIAFSGIQVRSQNTARASDVQAWKRIFASYRAVNGSWPTMAVQQDYCLGKGFPVGYGGVARCRDYQYQTGGGLYSALESDSTSLMAQLATVASQSPSTKVEVKGEGPNYAVVGPYAFLDADGSMIITGVFKGVSGQCPSGTTEQYADTVNKILWCQVKLLNGAT